MCDECIPDLDKSSFPKFKMSKEERAKLPGKEHAGRKVSSLNPTELEERRIFRRAYERIYRDWNRENGNYLKTYQAQYHVNYQQNHGDQLRDYVREYMKKNPDWILRSMERRELRKSLVRSEKYTTQNILDKWGTVCYLCNEEIDLSIRRSFKDKTEGWQKALTLDHVIPLSEGGPDTPDNVRPTHASCNTKKGTKVLEEYLTDEHRAAKVLFEELYGQRKVGKPLKD